MSLSWIRQVFRRRCFGWMSTGMFLFSLPQVSNSEPSRPSKKLKFCEYIQKYHPMDVRHKFRDRINDLRIAFPEKKRGETRIGSASFHGKSDLGAQTFEGKLNLFIQWYVNNDPRQYELLYEALDILEDPRLHIILSQKGDDNLAGQAGLCDGIPYVMMEDDKYNNNPEFSISNMAILVHELTHIGTALQYHMRSSPRALKIMDEELSYLAEFILTRVTDSDMSYGYMRFYREQMKTEEDVRKQLRILAQRGSLSVGK